MILRGRGIPSEFAGGDRPSDIAGGGDGLRDIAGGRTNQVILRRRDRPSDIAGSGPSDIAG